MIADKTSEADNNAVDKEKPTLACKRKLSCPNRFKSSMKLLKAHKLRSYGVVLIHDLLIRSFHIVCHIVRLSGKKRSSFNYGKVCYSVFDKASLHCGGMRILFSFYCSSRLFNRKFKYASYTFKLNDYFLTMLNDTLLFNNVKQQI